MARVVALRGVEVREALAAADGLAADGDVTVLVADWVGDVLLLGAHQRRTSALRGDAPGVLRRATGGVAIVAGAGTVYAALSMPEPSTMVACSMDRFLNRHLRGVVKALTRMGVPAQYMGRDFVSVHYRPAVWVGWDRAGSGVCRLELVVSVDRSFALPGALDGYASRARPALGGKVPITLVEAATASGAGVRDAAELCARLVERLPAALLSVPAALGGHGEPTLPIIANDLDDAERARGTRRADQIDAMGVDDDDGALVWSRPVEDAIGFVEAGVLLRADGSIARARIAGDFYAERAGLAALEGALSGLPATPGAVGAAVDGAFGPGRHVIEGLATLRSLQTALLDAVDRARTD